MAFVKISEQPSLYNDLEKKSVREILEDINTEDQKVALAVQKAIPQIEKLVTQIVPRMKQGGRIFYMGAGTSGRLGVLDASEIPPTFGMPPTLVIGLIAGGDTALRNPVENAEDDMRRGWEELVERNITDKDTVIGIAAGIGRSVFLIHICHLFECFFKLFGFDCFFCQRLSYDFSSIFGHTEDCVKASCRSLTGTICIHISACGTYFFHCSFKIAPVLPCIRCCCSCVF